MTTKHAPGSYHRVGGVKGTLKIRGAEKQFEKDSTFVYEPTYRVCGPRDEVKEWLKKNNKGDQDVVVKNWFSKENITKSKEIKKLYEQQVEDSNTDHFEKQEEKKKSKNQDLSVWSKLWKLYQAQRSDDKEVVTETKVEVSTIKSTVKSLSDGEFLNVSSMKKNGEGGVVVTDVSEFRHLSQDEADTFYRVVYKPETKSSVKGVENFMRNYGNVRETQIKKITDAISSGKKANISRGKSPSRAPLISPKRSKKTKGEDDLDDMLD